MTKLDDDRKETISIGLVVGSLWWAVLIPFIGYGVFLLVFITWIIAGLITPPSEGR